MSGPFLRPDAVAWLRRWREPLLAAGLAALGVRWAALASGPMAWVAGAMALVGGAVAFVGVRRALFRSPGGGVGVVQLDEGRLTYFGPLSGGTVAVRNILSVAFDPHQRPAHWVVRDAEATVLIPVDAEGTEALFDAFAQLPGFDVRSLLAANRGAITVATTLWRRDGEGGSAALPPPGNAG